MITENKRACSFAHLPMMARSSPTPASTDASVSLLRGATLKNACRSHVTCSTQVTASLREEATTDAGIDIEIQISMRTAGTATQNAAMCTNSDICALEAARVIARPLISGSKRHRNEW